jgi:hypothetical protein
VLARPFPVFRDSIREAIFHYMLNLLHYLINAESFPESGGTVYFTKNSIEYDLIHLDESSKDKSTPKRIGKAAEEFKQKLAAKQRLVVILMNRLASLGSNYLLYP